MPRVLFACMALLILALTAGPAAGQERLPAINPLTGKPFGPRAVADYEAEMARLDAEDAAVRQASEEAEARWQEARARNAERIKAFDDAVEDWREANPAPAGTTESMIHTSYDNDTALAEGAEITYFNRWNIPTHTVAFGPDGKPTGPVTQTQQGKAWETLGPRIPPGGGVAISYDKDFDGNEIISYARVFDKDGWVIGRYDFNFDGVPWRGETWDVATGRRNGGFQDDRLKPPKATLGGPLPVPDQVRFITGVCESCRPLMNEHNDLAHEINAIVIEMASLSKEHQHAYPPAQKPIRMRYEVLARRLAELTPRFEALRARVIACDKACRPAAEPPAEPPLVATLPDRPARLAPQGPGGYAPAGEDSLAIQPGPGVYPADDRDLQAVIDAAQAYLAAANCEGMACPVCDCDQARQAVQALYDMEQYLTAMQPYLAAAQADHFRQFRTQAESSIINGDQRARTIWAIGVHKTLNDFGSTLLDIASVAGWAKEIATSPTALDELSPAEFLDRLNGFYQASKDLESLTATLAEAESGKPEATGIADLVDVSGGVDKDFINNTTSTISDIKSIVTAAVEHGKDWRKILKDGGGLAALGQIGGRYLKSYSAQVLKGRQDALDALLREADAGDLAQANAYRDLQRAQARRWMAEDALVAVRAARRAYDGCAYAACGPFTISRPAIPAFRRVDPAGGGDGKLAWGEALRWFNLAIARTLPQLKPTPFHDDCPPDRDRPRTAADPPPAAPAGDGPDLSRPPFEPVADLAPPASFCSEVDRVRYLNDVYNPAVAAALANARLAQEHQARLNALFTEHMRANSPWWGQVRAERDAFEPVSAGTIARAEALRQMYAAILAIPIVPCPDAPPATPGPQTPAGPALTLPGPPTTPVRPAGTTPEDCPPKEGRQPITVGPNSKVGSGAQLRSKVGGMATGALLGALGVGGGGGGGGSDGPDLWTCKIKDSEYTVFDDPATGVSLKVGAKRAKGGKLVIFSEIARSPDKGTFQTAFLENPSTGETQAPVDVGPCDLWGEWKLTVSWTKDTYVNGEHVDHQEGGWSKTGLFSIPGVLSKTDAPDGLWKRMGFSNASNGAREMGMIFNVPAGGGPLTFVIHVTRPRGDPVTTVPFVLTLTEGPGGFVFTRAEDPPCPPVAAGDGPSIAGDPATSAGEPPSPPPPAAPAPPTTPAPPPVSSPTEPRPPEGASTGSLSRPPPEPLYKTYQDPEVIRDSAAKAVARDRAKRKALEEARCLGPEAWEKRRQSRLSELRAQLELVQALKPDGPHADEIATMITGETIRLSEEILDIEAMQPPPAADTCPNDGFESILDEIDEVLVPS